MESELLAKWVQEARQQARFGKIAWQGLRNSLNGMDSEKAFFYIHAFLDRARQLRELLWPQGPDEQGRGEALRGVLKAKDSSPLNSPELEFLAGATDEHFARWLAAQDHLHYLEMNVMPQGTMAEFQQDVFLRNLDPDLYEFRWYDRKLSLRPVAEALRDVDSVAESWLKRRSAR